MLEKDHDDDRQDPRQPDRARPTEFTAIWDVVQYAELPPTDFFSPPEFYGGYQAVSKQLPFGLEEPLRIIAFGLSMLCRMLPGQRQQNNYSKGLISECTAQVVASADSYFAPSWREKHESLGIMVVAGLARGALNGKLQSPKWEERLRGKAEDLIAEHIRPLLQDRYHAIVNCYGQNGKLPAADFCENSCNCHRLNRHRYDYKERVKRCTNLHGIHNFCGSLSLDRWNQTLDIAMVGTNFRGGFATEGILAKYR